jgi:deazaflavin-dependent oxidoreductase (nitroreductase family)
VLPHRFDELRKDLVRQGFRTLNSVVRPIAKAGLTSPLPIGIGIVVVETTGRKSGKTREVPLVATRIGDRIDVSTVRRDSQWVKNLAADPDGAVWLKGERRVATADITEGDFLTRATFEL